MLRRQPRHDPAGEFAPGHVHCASQGPPRRAPEGPLLNSSGELTKDPRTLTFGEAPGQKHHYPRVDGSVKSSVFVNMPGHLEILEALPSLLGELTGLSTRSDRVSARWTD